MVYKKGNVPWNIGLKESIPKIPILCACGCGEVVWNGNGNYKQGHGSRNNPLFLERTPWNKGKKNPKFSGERHPLFGKKPTKETLKKISAALKGRTSPNKGNHLTDEQKIRLRNLRKGKKHWNFGKHLSEETKKKISKANKGKKRNNYVPWNKGISFCVLNVRRSGDKNPRWQGGISYIPYCPKFNKQLKERIRERDNRTCQLCGTKENGKKLAVHHIHYDKPNCDPDLIALCNNCNLKANMNRDYYENLFMEKLKVRGLI